jgi:hypothetical protein
MKVSEIKGIQAGQTLGQFLMKPGILGNDHKGRQVFSKDDLKHVPECFTSSGNYDNARTAAKWIATHWDDQISVRSFDRDIIEEGYAISIGDGDVLVIAQPSEEAVQAALFPKTTAAKAITLFVKNTRGDEDEAEGDW